LQKLSTLKACLLPGVLPLTDCIKIRATARVTPIITVTLYSQRNVLKQLRQYWCLYGALLHIVVHMAIILATTTGVVAMSIGLAVVIAGFKT
jgi:hypothetical protein